MRLLIATAITLAAIATPAAAQKLDARRSTGGIDEDHAYCKFTAYPELRLEHRTDGSDAMIGIPGRLKSIAPRVCSR